MTFVVLNLFISVILVAFNEEQKHSQVSPFDLVFKSHYLSTRKRLVERQQILGGLEGPL